MIYQIRVVKGYKLAEFDLKDEANDYLSKRPLTGLDVWMLDAMPGELLDIITATEFIHINL